MSSTPCRRQIALGLILPLLVATVPLTTVAPASAQHPELRPDPGLRSVGQEVSDLFIALALRSPQYRQAARALADRHGGTFLPRPSQSHSLAAGDHIGVVVPISGGAGYSAIQLWFDRELRQVAKTVVHLFDRTADQHFEAFVAIDGVARVHATLTEEGRVLDGWFLDEGGVQQALADVSLSTKSVGCFFQCLRDEGVPAAVIFIISFTCLIICLETLGLGCGICALAAAVGWGFEIGRCQTVCF